MAFRKFWKDHPEIDLHGSLENPPVTLKVVGIDGGYHGDTLGAMDAVAPSPYNGPAQYPWSAQILPCLVIQLRSVCHQNSPSGR